ncbi:MAG: undecaprenyl-diphosphatase [Gammaproteobacteria bacterium CG22_combo_CG10-13_8_21_14_all_40_8]|nr:MAG: undecaprenyl-diphosphatase [Gammaproteobacteria bacterium CG22_combo_CG10-13_8_21_14_all_40_8]
MSYFHAFILALIQGLTEFLPISSSAHLILPAEIFGWPPQGNAFDVAVHVGTLMAVIAYFKEELQAMTLAWFNHVFKQQATDDSRLAWAVLWGTVPVGLAGLIFQHFIEDNLRTSMVIATTTLIFAGFLWWSDRLAAQNTRSEYQLTYEDIFWVGCAQMLALIPGTSRSGATMTAGLMLGLSRSGSARFSFLLSIPVIVLAGGLKGIELIQQTETVPWGQMGLGICVSAVSAYLSIHYFLKLLEKLGMLPFVIYRLLLGVVLMGWLLS